jgi:predicted transcriptional regulator
VSVLLDVYLVTGRPSGRPFCISIKPDTFLIHMDTAHSNLIKASILFAPEVPRIDNHQLKQMAIMDELPTGEALRANYSRIVADIVSAYVSSNSVRHQELGELIADVHASIVAIEKGPVVEAPPTKREPAVSIKKSLGDGEYLISMIDGKQYRTLKRHIGRHGFTPESYRAEFGLPGNYPMVASSYSAARSQLAKDIGLGGKISDDPPRPVKLLPKGPGKRGRPKNTA